MDIRITNFTEVSVGKKKIIVYRIDISFKEWRNIVEKRFSEFHELHDVMKLIRKIIKKPISEIPSKMAFKYIFNNITQKDLEKRRNDLENYLKNLEISPCARNSKFFPDFVGLPLRYRDEWAINNI